MEILLGIFGFISDLGSTVMVPVMITIVGLVLGLDFFKALKSGMTVGIGLIGINLVMNLVWTYMTPVAQALVEVFNLPLSYVDMGWSYVAAVAFSTTVGTFVIPFCLLINIVMLVIKATKTVDIDIWNYWHCAFTGSVVYATTKNYAIAFMAAGLHFVATLVMGDRFAKMVQEEMDLPGISLPHGSAAPALVIGWLANKFLDLFFKGGDKKEEKNTGGIAANPFVRFITDPMMIGLILGTVLALIVKNSIAVSLQTGMAMAALMFLLPRMVKVLMEGLLPLSTAAKKTMAKKFSGQEFFIGMDSAVCLGHPTALSTSLVLIPLTLIIAMILPGNVVLPLGDLASTAYYTAMTTIPSRGKFGRTLFGACIVQALACYAGTYFADATTTVAVAQGLAEEGALVSSLSATWMDILVHFIARQGWIGFGIMAALIVALVLWHRGWVTKQPKVTDAE
ncbi:MAG: PTS galactitol transporter subunit IIC [Erysipelotrichaceae bacterium]|nr:PTS galactitol transporter subunit IIC [Erysipelotrichaceae bacterium]MBQ1534109.1 PTS galactitol transporter subunit IIC [Erysipelotrichaceae bacterium]MBQ1787712.1 PTS galactitol transporter subunit IIC [Erysipelotrichaceae bacterium]